MNDRNNVFSFNFDSLIPGDGSLSHFFRLETTNKWDEWDVDRILKSGPVTIVFWKDGTKTMVRRAPDEEDNTYAAFTAALAIKLFGSNSALKRMLKEKVEVQKLKKKSTECTDTCPIDFEAIERNLATANSAKDPQEAADYMAKALMGHD